MSGQRALRISSATAVAAAVVIAVLANVLAARHYRRWDWTESGLYTLSPLTKQTLVGLRQPIEVWVLLSSADPTALSLRHLLESYRAETGLIEVHYVDPDSDRAELAAVQQRFHLSTAKTEDGELVADAQVIVAQGDRRHFLTAYDLVQVIDEGEDMQARPQLEEALSGAIRKLSLGEPTRVCVTTGHGEPAITLGGPEGLADLASRLDKLNYRVEELPSLRDLEGRDPIGGCKLTIVAAPQQLVPPDDVARLVGYVKTGGNLLVVIGPLPDEQSRGYLDLGLAPLLQLAGVRKRDDFVFELDPARASSGGFGETFIAVPRPHPVSAGFVGSDVNIVVTVASSLEPIEGAAVVPAPLLATSERSFGMRDFFAWAQSRRAPERESRDTPGPLVIAYAAELPQPKPAGALHGPRIVVLGTTSAIYGANWQNDQLRGTSLFVENAVAWLAAEPIALDLPAKPSRPLGHGVTRELLDSAAWRVVGLVPGAIAAIGVAIQLRRRASDTRARRKQARPQDKEQS